MVNSPEISDLTIQLPILIQHKSLVAYRLPNATETNIAIGNAQEIKSLGEALGNKGFVFTPSETSHHHPSYLLMPDQSWQVADLEALQIGDLDLPVASTRPIFSTQAEYLAQAAAIIEAITSSEVEKAILSRVKKQDVEHFSPWETYKNLCAAYPSVMVYWVSIPGVGTWLGATPETLLRLDNGQAETVALTGTQPHGTLPLEKVVWSAKEIEEQRIVNDNITNLIHEYYPAVALETNGPHTVSTGALLHLKTSFRWRVPKDVAALESFIKALHPTPAIVGEPRTPALNLIAETESHDRAYYTGLLGPVDRNGLTHLFVNLRCMQVFPGYLALYLGGGITAASQPEAEWDETELKAQTLLRVVNG